jgi:glycosyltransferase involved in cell wall biosynthesis
MTHETPGPGRRPRALFIAPTTPADSGNGLAMRAALLLEGLARECDVSLLVVPVSGPAPGRWPQAVVDRTVERMCLPLPPCQGDLRTGAGGEDALAMRERFLLPTLARAVGSGRFEEARRLVADRTTVAVLLIMRLYLAPLVAAFPSHRLALLDLDDDEISTRHRLAARYAELGQIAFSEAEAAEAGKYRILESRWLSSFDALFTCSERDRAAIAARSGHPAVHVVPNGVRRSGDARVLAGTPDGCVHLLFVGSLGYFPNVDAATILCRDVLPAVRAGLGTAVRVDLVGARPDPAVLELGRLDGVAVHADVEDVAPFYRRAHVAVAPIRAGGGTRLKILEAFACGVPVVSTSLGAEGLDVVAGQHLLIAEESTEIADACCRIIRERDLARRIQRNAAALVASAYDASIVAGRMAALVRERLLADPERRDPAR